jgi:hypothetical protein
VSIFVYCRGLPLGSWTSFGSSEAESSSVYSFSDSLVPVLSNQRNHSVFAKRTCACGVQKRHWYSLPCSSCRCPHQGVALSPCRSQYRKDSFVVAKHFCVKPVKKLLTLQYKEALQRHCCYRVIQSSIETSIYLALSRFIPRLLLL